jgi:alpha-L-glutamate ligase-like protein
MTKWLQEALDNLKSGPDRSSLVLGMNQRNLDYIQSHNQRRDFELADDKLLTKEIMEAAGVPVPRTYRAYRHLFELERIERDLSPYPEFVIKPAHGRGGGGILVIAQRQQGAWIGVGGTSYPVEALRRHLSDVIFGVFSFEHLDAAIIEERIRQLSAVDTLSPFGLADIRVILLQDQPIMAMMRVPTRQSRGRANLHQGALGIGLDLPTGGMVNAVLHGRRLQRHPDTGVALCGQTVPCWNEVLRISRAAARALPLKYIGADIALAEQGPVLLEVNVRPGLEIQNANLVGLRPRLEAVEGGLEPPS